VGVVEGLLRPQEIIFSVPKNDKFVCILPQFLTTANTDSHFKTLKHGFYGSIVKRSLHEQCNNYTKSRGETKEGGRIISHHPEYATVRNSTNCNCSL